jgi:hypothetical protein
MRIFVSIVAGSLVLGGVASAQSLNVDVGANGVFPAPSVTYAAAGQAGVWNAVPAPALAAALVGLDGMPSAATLTSTGGFLNFGFDNAGTSGDAQDLLDDAQDLGGSTSIAHWTFAGLADGAYTVTTYAWAPDNAGFRTGVSVLGSPDPTVDVGGAWTGAHVVGVTYARHQIVVVGGALSIELSATNGFGSLNGIQLVRATDFVATCVGDGSGAACPCGNSGSVGRGCANSIDPSGGLLGATGTASVATDTLVLAGSGMPSSSALYFQGSTAAGGGNGVAFGDGLRCAGGAVVRLSTKTNVGGLSQYPEVGDLSVSVRGGVAPGNQRVYQVWYRNAASFCTSDTFNLTNGLVVDWGV